MNSIDIKNFYNKNQFPGHYTAQGLLYHNEQIKNPYLKIINQYLQSNNQVLDVGCGTGLISNLFATKYPTAQFTSVDFSDGIDYAKDYAKTNNIKNVKYLKKDFLEFKVSTQYDVVICQGVLHHIPEYNKAIEKIKLLIKPSGILILGLYHPGGKILKKMFNLDYKNKILKVDQELVPYETSFLCGKVKQMFNEYKLINSYPQITPLTAIKSIFNYRNGGLITYVFKNYD